MKERALLMRRPFGEGQVFDSVNEAAEELGVTASAISRSITKKTLCRGCRFSWVSRIYVVKTTAGEYLVCVMGKDGTLQEMGKMEEVRKSVVKDVRDVTKSMWI